MTAAITLPTELTIYSVASLRAEWLTALSATESHDPCVVDGAAVDQIDAAGLQLLLALSHSLAERQRPLHLSPASRVLRSACQDLGLTQVLLAPTHAEELA